MCARVQGESPSLFSFFLFYLWAKNFSGKKRHLRQFFYSSGLNFDGFSLICSRDIPFKIALLHDFDGRAGPTADFLAFGYNHLINTAVPKTLVKASNTAEGTFGLAFRSRHTPRVTVEAWSGLFTLNLIGLRWCPFFVCGNAYIQLFYFIIFIHS